MRFFYNYAVMYVDRNNYLRAMELRADNPEHLKKRFSEKCPDSVILSYVVYDGVLKDRIRAKRKITLNEDETYLYIDSLSYDELLDCKVSDVYDDYLSYCTNEMIQPNDVCIFNKKLRTHFELLTSKVCKINGKTHRVYKLK